MLKSYLDWQTVAIPTVTKKREKYFPVLHLWLKPRDSPFLLYLRQCLYYRNIVSPWFYNINLTGITGVKGHLIQLKKDKLLQKLFFGKVRHKDFEVKYRSDSNISKSRKLCRILSAKSQAKHKWNQARIFLHVLVITGMFKRTKKPFQKSNTDLKLNLWHE